MYFKYAMVWCSQSTKVPISWQWSAVGPTPGQMAATFGAETELHLANLMIERMDYKSLRELIELHLIFI